MDTKALFKINCGLFLTAVELNGTLNGCITNTLMQQSHSPLRLSLTVQKANLTHDMIRDKGSVAISILSTQVEVATVRRFGFVSGRDREKFADIMYELDSNGNPYLTGHQISANLFLRVYDTVDVGTHTMFLCEPVDMQNGELDAITYSGYQQSLKHVTNK